MLELITAPPAAGNSHFEEAVSLFRRNFPVHSGIAVTPAPVRAPVALLYGDCSFDSLRSHAGTCRGLVAIPALPPGNPRACREADAYRFGGAEVPLFAPVATPDLPGFRPFAATEKGHTLAWEGRLGGAEVLLFTADLVSESHLLLSGALEAETGTDRHGRHNPSAPAAYRTPAASFHFNLAANAVRRVFHRSGLPLLYLPRWPASAPMALFLSHDVDAVRKWTGKRVLYELARAALRGQSPGPTLRSVAAGLRGRDPYWSFDELLDLEAEFGFPSTWFFAPFGGDYDRRTRPIDPVYRRPQSELAEAFGRIGERGCEIGLHGVRNAFVEAAELRRQREHLERQTGGRLDGLRFHYLMFRHGITCAAAAEAGLRYDASRGFSDRAGFRDGMASPWFPLEGSDLVELPLHCMDRLFQHASDPETAAAEVLEAYRLARAAGGMFSFLLHPGCLDPLEIPGLAALYGELLSRARDDGCRGMTGRRMCDWWLARERVLHSLDFSPGRWRVAGVPVPGEMEFAFSLPPGCAQEVSLESGDPVEQRRRNGALVLRPGPVESRGGVTFVLR